ncbi:hypothetical protein [Jeotgalibacillus soli]|uniref:Uncharacterized protein n=1 Tax=Jeotgalibacillus soli TaxID=889306 RepID=A0A0C2VUT5_9BACL|nr:hypothetical protein [Jeotgalibacillus soli]KIL48191.1 hypothetical protein KP78_16380 [Jeotgalibacillus soli]
MSVKSFSIAFLIIFLLAGCNPFRVDEAVDNNENPEVEKLVDDENEIEVSE